MNGLSESTIVHALGNGDPRSEAITLDELREWVRGTSGQSNDAAVEEEITPERFFAALEQAKQNRTRAAHILGASRAQFYRFMKKFDEK